MRVVVIGAGAAGLIASAEAAKRGASVLLLEKNSKTGVKILMSGGTRCNLTHDTDARGITEAFGHAKRFLQPSVGAFPPDDVVKMFADLGVSTKIESTGKVFPVSNRAVEVRDALHSQAIEAGVKIQLKSGVTSISSRNSGGWTLHCDSASVEADRVIVTAGGKSWPGCGTTGDAYQWLRELGHTIVPPQPALVPLVGGFDWTKELSGITLPDSIAAVYLSTGKRKQLVERRSSWLFTHFGFSGPAAMDVSRHLTTAASLRDVSLQVDLIPGVTADEILARLTDRSRGGGKQRLASVFAQWLPSRLADAIAEQAGGNQTIAELPKHASQLALELTKRLRLPINGTKGFAKAEVTAGGVHLKEVNPKTMASRIARDLYIAGEVLDVDGWIGGYNFQAAFSTGRAAGIAAAATPIED